MEVDVARKPDSNPMLSFCAEHGLDPRMYAIDPSAFPRFFRLNRLAVADRDGEAEAVEAAALALHPSTRRLSWLPSFFLADSSALHLAASSLYKDGLLYGMDASSAASVYLLNPQPGERVLDVCCAPGAKLCLIADLMGCRGSLTGVDISRSRLSACATMLRKYGVVRPGAAQCQWRLQVYCEDGTAFNRKPGSAIDWGLLLEKEGKVDKTKLLNHLLKAGDKGARAMVVPGRMVVSTKSSTDRLGGSTATATATATATGAGAHAEAPAFPSSASECSSEATSTAPPASSALSPSVTPSPSSSSSQLSRRSRSPGGTSCGGNDDRSSEHSAEDERADFLPVADASTLRDGDEEEDDAVCAAAAATSTSSSSSSSPSSPSLVVDSLSENCFQKPVKDVASLRRGFAPPTTGRLRGALLDLERLQELHSKPSDSDSTTVTDDDRLYDRVLVDAECTHDGSIRHVAKAGSGFDWGGWEQRTAAASSSSSSSFGGVAPVVALQHKLLLNGFSLLRRGGTLVYSTCSLASAQNEGVIRWLLEECEATRGKAALLPIPLAHPVCHPTPRGASSAVPATVASPILAPVDAVCSMPIDALKEHYASLHSASTSSGDSGSDGEAIPPWLPGGIEGTVRFEPARCGCSGLFIARLTKL